MGCKSLRGTKTLYSENILAGSSGYSTYQDAKEDDLIASTLPFGGPYEEPPSSQKDSTEAIPSNVSGQFTHNPAVQSMGKGAIISVPSDDEDFIPAKVVIKQSMHSLLETVQ